MKKWSEFLFNQVKWQVTQANYWKRKFASSYVRKNHVLGCQIVIYVYSIFVFSRIGMAEKFMRPTHSYWINWIVSLSSEYERQTSKTIDSTIHNNIDDDSEIKILCLRGITLISVVRLQCNIFTEHFSGKSHSQTERRQFQFPVYATNEQHFWRKRDNNHKIHTIIIVLPAIMHKKDIYVYVCWRNQLTFDSNEYSHDNMISSKMMH